MLLLVTVVAHFWLAGTKPAFAQAVRALSTEDESGGALPGATVLVQSFDGRQERQETLVREWCT